MILVESDSIAKKRIPPDEGGIYCKVMNVQD